MNLSLIIVGVVQIRMKKIILDALIDIIQASLRQKTEWNVNAIMTIDEDPSTSGKQQSRQNHRMRRKVDI